MDVRLGRAEADLWGIHQADSAVDGCTLVRAAARWSGQLHAGQGGCLLVRARAAACWSGHLRADQDEPVSLGLAAVRPADPRDRRWRSRIQVPPTTPAKRRP